jgi:carboxylesterase
VDDDVSTPRSADFVTSHIGSDHVHKILLHNSYHMITMDNERELVADETIRFFNGLTGMATPEQDAEQRPVISSAPRLGLVHAA